jgi:antitoxin component of RelBE/YafQ-DinJ toxin-antitoxin module
MAKKDSKDRLTISIDANLKRQFDTVTTWKGLNMSDVTQSLIADWVKANAPPGILEENQSQAQHNLD